MDTIELLAPAGDLKRLKIALLYGADAVYIGGQQFSLRSRASNFSLEDIREGAAFAREHGKKVHVTVNMLPHEDDLGGLDDYVRALADAGVHALIVASPSIARRVKELAPSLEVHISTQHSTTNASAIRFWKEQGMDRVVLARECTLEEVRASCANAVLPVEVFIHGGMCISYSGRCVLSNHMTNRDANRGGCAQSCRWKYALYEGEREISDPDMRFSMSSKDLQAVRFIPALIEAGVSSLKIEGRMKSAYYIATVVHAYRMLIDEYAQTGTLNEERIAFYEEEIAKAETDPPAPVFIWGCRKRRTSSMASTAPGSHRSTSRMCSRMMSGHRRPCCRCAITSIRTSMRRCLARTRHRPVFKSKRSATWKVTSWTCSTSRCSWSG